MAKALLPRASLILPLVLLGGCNLLGEDVATASSTVQTSLLPTSVPYYLDLCGQSESSPSYDLIAPARLERWLTGSPSKRAKRQACADEREIENGDPITVRLHRVGIGGLSEFDDKGNCRKGCRRDVAIVIDFNGSDTLQKPIVAFYQRNVTPDANLQFTNFTIYTQNEWFFRYPPSVRVRLYDVRIDKDQELRTQLDSIARGKDQILSFVAGAAIAGPLVDTAIDVAKKLTSGPRNRPILDMAFQLFPQEQDADSAGGKGRARQLLAAQQQPEAEIPTAELSKAEISALQRKLKVDLSGGGDGTLGPLTQAALAKEHAELATTLAGTPQYRRRARMLLKPEAKHEDSGRNDWTFGAPIFASQFIVFNEDAPPIKGCDAVWRGSTETRRAMLGADLPRYRFVPDGVSYGGARVYGTLNQSSCMLESPYVVFSITRESSAVAVDVAKRISDLQAKFTASAAVNEDSVTSLGAALVDAELALAIDRLENGRKADQLLGLLTRLRDRYQAKKDDPNGLPLPSATFRSRAFKLISDYTGCTVAEGVDVAYLTSLIDGLKDLEPGLKRERGWQKPYFGGRLPEGFKCPALAALPEQPPAPLPPPPAVDAASVPTDPAAVDPAPPAAPETEGNPAGESVDEQD